MVMREDENLEVLNPTMDPLLSPASSGLVGNSLVGEDREPARPVDLLME